MSAEAWLPIKEKPLEEHKMKIVIIGGVAGGMSAATRLRRLMEDAEIIVFDKGPYVSFANCGLPFHVSGEIAERSSLLVQTPESLKSRFEQDHRPIKRRNKFYRSLRTASTTIKGMETLRGIYKKNRRNGTLFGFSVSTEIKILMGIPA